MSSNTRNGAPHTGIEYQAHDFMEKHELTRSFSNLFEKIGNKNWKSYQKVQKELLKGKPLDLVHVSEILKVSLSETKEIIDQFGELNEEGKLVGIAGLSIVPTKHRFEVDGKVFYTWCAADALFFPSALNITADVTSVDPVNHEKIKLTISPDKLEKVVPGTAVVSIVETADTCNIRSTLCDRVHFFTSSETGNEWKKNNTDARILPVEILFEIREFLTDPNCC